MESEVANVPRIIIDEKVLQVARESRDEMHSPEDEEEYVRAFMTKDSDGLHYFDYVSWKSVVEVTGGNNDLYGDYLDRIGQLVREGLGHADPRVQAKYLWLYPQYVAAIDLVTSLPAGHGYRDENPELCERVASLPRYNDLAASATAAAAAVKASKKIE